MGPVARQLLNAIDEYYLVRWPSVAALKAIVLQGRVREPQARGYLLSLQPLIRLQQKRPNYLPAPDEEDLHTVKCPDVTLGKTMDTEVRFGLNLSDRTEHLITAGLTGCGKSTLMRRLSNSAYEYSRTTGNHFAQIILDKKKDYVDRRSLGADWLMVDVYEGLRVGLNKPSLVPIWAWVAAITTSFAVRAGLVAARTCLANMIHWALPVLNPDGEPRLWPSFRLLLDIAQAAPLDLWSPKPDYARSLITKLYDVADNAGGLWNTFNGLELNRDVIAKRRHIVIGCQHVSPPWVRLFLVDLLCYQILLPRLFSHRRADRTEVILFLDESDDDLSRRAEADMEGGLTPLGELFKKGRELGVMVAASTSFLGNVSRFALANAGNLFLFAQPDAESQWEALRCLGLLTSR